MPIRVNGDNKCMAQEIGHFHHRALLYMLKNDMVQGLSSMEDEHASRNTCQFEKQSGIPFAKASNLESTVEASISPY